MADERDFELLDDYLTNRMSKDDRSAFEQKIQADPNLQHEYALQKRLVEGIKNARVAELKSMLNKVSVPANHTGTTLASKILLGTAVTLIAAAGYWYFTQTTGLHKADTIIIAQEPVTTQDHQVTPEAKTPQEPVQNSPMVRQKPQVQVDKNQTSAGTEDSKPSLAKKPEPLAAPAPDKRRRNGPATSVAPDASGTGEAQDNDKDQTDKIPDAALFVVETDTENALYNFHYQFLGGKVVLFGPFTPRSYELIHLAGEESQIFLHYKDQYYPLENSDDGVRPLQVVSDPALLQKLREAGK